MNHLCILPVNLLITLFAKDMLGLGYYCCCTSRRGLQRLGVAGVRRESVRTLEGLALPRASHSSDIALSGLRCQRFTLAATPVLFMHAIVTVA